jgi:predicted Zn-dependent protease
VSIHPAPASTAASSAALTEAFEKDIPLDVLRVMTQSALAAVCQNMPDQAQRIIDGLTPHFLPYTAVAMARATVAMATGRHAEALQMLERLTKTNPQIDAVICACAMLKKEMGVPGWRALAQRVIDRGADADAIGIAEEMLALPAARAGSAATAHAAESKGMP